MRNARAAEELDVIAKQLRWTAEQIENRADEMREFFAHDEASGTPDEYADRTSGLSEVIVNVKRDVTNIENYVERHFK